MEGWRGKGLGGGPVRGNLGPMLGRLWREDGVGAFPVHSGCQLQLTEGLFFVQKDPTWTPSVRLSHWRLLMNQLLPDIYCLWSELWVFFAAVCGLQSHSRPLGTGTSGLSSGPWTGEHELSPLRWHPETAASLLS